MHKFYSVAVVDDEENIRETVSYALKKAGYNPICFSDGLAAWEAFLRQVPDLVILDIIMPRMDGLELCRRIRSRWESLPVIFLSSKDEELDRILGLEIGGDDYLCKPFSMRELLTRVKVLFRRLALTPGEPVAEEILQIGDISLDLKRYTVRWKQINVPLTVTEFLLLQTLATGNGHVKTREQLMQSAYPDNTFVSPRTIDSHIKRLRQKFIQVDPGFNNIDTIYGLGYRYSI